MTKFNQNSASSSDETKLAKKAYDAFHAAKQRCNNPNNPSYPNYGALGVKVLFAHFHEFLDHIGLPPNSSASLDRIDPEGNYEIGNVRWASKSVQACNKKGGSLGSSLSTQQKKAILLDKQSARKRREEAAEIWDDCLFAILNGGFSKEQVDRFVKLKVAPEFFEAGWELGQARDWCEPISYFHMPSLTHLGERVRLSGGPLSTFPFDYDGIIPRLDHINAATKLALKKPFITAPNGSVLEGGKASAWRRVGGVEGIMMIAASRMKALDKNVAFFPLMTALANLDAIGPRYKWDEERSKVLDVYYLFIPDFQIDCGKAVQPTWQEWNVLGALLDYRMKRGFQTYLGIQNFNGLPASIEEKILLNMHTQKLPEHPSLDEVSDFCATGPKAPTIGFNAVASALTVAKGQPSS